MYSDIIIRNEHGSIMCTKKRPLIFIIQLNHFIILKKFSKRNRLPLLPFYLIIITKYRAISVHNNLLRHNIEVVPEGFDIPTRFLRETGEGGIII